MKGLLTKDFALLLQRKKTFLFLAVWAVIMGLTMDDGSFVIGWMSIIAAFFSVSSLTYDEYDNCYPFLMSLPVTGRIYVKEKYLFGFLCGIGAWLFSAIVFFSIAAIKGTATELGEELLGVCVFIPVFMLLIDISLPLDMKFGSERGRMIILIIWGIAFLGVFGANKLFGASLSFDETSVSEGTAVLFAFLITAVLTAISVAVTYSIVDKKEY